MTPEEQERYARIDRQIEFLANHQAQLSADIENLKQIAATHTTQIGRLADTVLSLVHVVEEQSRRSEERFRAIDERFRATDELFRATDERLRATDERLNTLIGVVERYFSNGRHE